MEKRLRPEPGLRKTVPAAPHLALGKAGEDAACDFLEGTGLYVCDRNWRPEGLNRSFELDLVARDKDLVVFVEVKTRSVPVSGLSPASESSPASGPSPEGSLACMAFTPAKQRNIVRAAHAYLSEKELWDKPCRFDLIAVERQPDGKLVLEHISDVIELGHTLDCGHTAWQPW